MEILLIIFGVLVIAFVVGFYYKVSYKYLFEYGYTKVNVWNRTIQINNKIIPFDNINEVDVRILSISFYERFLVSVLLYLGVAEMELVLNDGTTEIVRLPKYWILVFCKQMKSAGVKIRETW